MPGNRVIVRFIGEGSDAVIGTPQAPWAWGKKFRAYEKATDQVIWEPSCRLARSVRR